MRNFEIDPITDEYDEREAREQMDTDYDFHAEEMYMARRDREDNDNIEDQLLDMTMEDRIGGTGVPDFESWNGDGDGSVGCD